MSVFYTRLFGRTKAASESKSSINLLEFDSSKVALNFPSPGHSESQKLSENIQSLKQDYHLERRFWL